MVNLSHTGRIFYGIAMAALGFLTIYYRDFPYMMIPPHSGKNGLVIIACLSGILLILAGAGIVLKIKALPIALLLGAALLGAKIFTWFIILHIPKAIAERPSGMGGETTSAFLALAYSGIAFAIAGGAKT